MNREILFRGKRVDNGEWVEGYLVEGFATDDKKRSYICPYLYSVLIHDDTLMLGGFIEVDPTTVGQYTGLTDKNGQKVFIGDIVNCSCGCPHEVIWLMEHGGKYIGGMPGVYLSCLGDGYAWIGDEEIIGNIHDNPELVGGAEHDD